ncbi:hypothetical protein ACFQY5_00835 [Paeniroseomonas aquatica]|uniref:Uncharacterized protein n=1 Tax=Paeniroseomonas aquatica TaxID=373043 RepID=A0ABT8A0Y2_9PROT|nr:hypothetical protein [Paeniroseomonas aquatica]MDN3563266.1 hypothetical protein [Paeniroseomonas aquatica]
MRHTPLPGLWAAASPAERSAAHDSGRAVPDSAALIAARNAEAAPFRAARPGHPGLGYDAGPRNAWDLFPARQSRDVHARRAGAHAPGPLIPVASADHFRILEAQQPPGGELPRASEALLRHRR